MWGIHLLGAVTLALSLHLLAAATVEDILFAVLLVLFAIFVADECLLRYHSRQLEAIAPRVDGVAVVTGASSGLGREIAYLLGEKGFHLVLVGRSKERLERIAVEIHDVWDVHVHVCVTDLGTPAGPPTIVDFVASLKLEIDILVNCAGGTQRGVFSTLSSTTITDMMQLNVLSVTSLCHLVLPSMLARKSGRILNISSISGANAMPLAAMYAASKAFMLRLSQGLAFECRGQVGVTAFCPGPLRTQFATTTGSANSIMFKLPFFVHDVNVAAKCAVASMLDGDVIAFDSWMSKLLYFAGSTFAEKRLTLTLSACCWSDMDAIRDAIWS
ncbi:hypothetical protein H310_11445 [Aphanomyces invadans]|uniref:Ketoreductase domain-containing protein n=1 Tax=Aphanomyces invadans TaxID=157072 RepID=A0A024TMC1_9STRA|nr:hypothetical protein H310_11445 [Aphanomyces invadans]ETV95183.1 hypothetical protein H310_11445 [Aphanomyces invadans]|eukprot:XP_008876356.1 hypothetical protein H310_11445 [Aphanomyces invadans]